MSASSQKSGLSHTTLGQERALEPDLEKQPTVTNDEAPTPTALFPVSDLSKGIVGWESQDDPENPQNFANGKKWALLALISAFTLVSPLASSMFSPAVVYMGEEFGESNEIILALSVSIYLIGYTVSFPAVTIEIMRSNGT
jgi:hypothetical protein